MKVLVSGCFDLLHSGHIRFFEEASSYGDLTVALGSERTIFELKRRMPVNNDAERLYAVKSIRFVTDAFISTGSGKIDFREQALKLHPNVFVVNEDGHSEEKQRFVEQELKARYVILPRRPAENLPARSTTALRKMNLFPYRIDIAGGWLDQPDVSEHCAGPVITLSIEPTHEFNERSGMATSTRNTMKRLFSAAPFLSSASFSPLFSPPPSSGETFDEPLERSARLLFAADNPPGSPHVSGSQDTIGLVYPGLACSHYAAKYWPERIERCNDESVLRFIERSIRLYPLEPRKDHYNPLNDKRLEKDQVERLAGAAERCWQALMGQNLKEFGAAVSDSFNAQVALFPHMVNETVENAIEFAKSKLDAHGWKLTGAGGGGYLVIIVDPESPKTIEMTEKEHLLEVIARR